MWFLDVVSLSLSVRLPVCLCRRIEREEGARRLLEEKMATVQETAKTCANEVSHLRKRRRELEAKNAEIRYTILYHCTIILCNCVVGQRQRWVTGGRPIALLCVYNLGLILLEVVCCGVV